MANRIENTKERVDELLQEYRHAAKTVQEERERLGVLKAAVQDTAEARDLIQRAAQAIQVRAHEQVSRVVTRCLKTVFGESGYEFKIHFDRKRGRTEARMVFVRAGREVHPTSGAGGGVVDLAALALRVACLLLATPKRRKLLVLDEPLAKLSKEYTERVRQLIETLAEELDVQFVLVTHNRDLVCGKVVEIGE